MEKQDSIIASIDVIEEKNESAKQEENQNIYKLAISVIRGNYGNGEERKQRLGTQYTIIQNKVNEIYRQGIK